METFLDKLDVDTSLGDEIGFNPYYNKLSSALAKLVIVNNKPKINLASNNYLGLADDKRVKKSFIKGIKKYGASLCGTPIATGNAEVLVDTQRRLSSFIGLEDGVILPSCYQANVGIFSILVGKNDVIYFDHYVHSSIIEGIKASGAKMKPFLHNDMVHLKKQLKKEKTLGKKIIVSESVFSTEGSICPLDKIVQLADLYGAVPFVDDSHGIGVLGVGGAGILSHFKIDNFNGIYTASLGKALANQGGYIGAKKNVIKFIKYSYPSLIYSTALVPGILYGINGVLDILEKDFEKISKKMWSYRGRIIKILQKNNIPFSNSEAPIISIKTGSFEKTVMVSKALYDMGIFSTPFVPPSVPLGQSVVRLIVGANLKEKTIDNVEKIISELGSFFDKDNI